MLLPAVLLPVVLLPAGLSLAERWPPEHLQQEERPGGWGRSTSNASQAGWSRASVRPGYGFEHLSGMRPAQPPPSSPACWLLPRLKQPHHPQRAQQDCDHQHSHFDPQ